MSIDNKNSQHVGEKTSCWEGTLKHYKYEEKLKQTTEFLPVNEKDCLYYCDKRVYAENDGRVLTSISVRSIKKVLVSIDGFKKDGIIANDFPENGKVVIVSDGHVLQMREKNGQLKPLFCKIADCDKNKFLFNELALKFFNEEEHDKYLEMKKAEEEKARAEEEKAKAVEREKDDKCCCHDDDDDHEKCCCHKKDDDDCDCHDDDDEKHCCCHKEDDDCDCDKHCDCHDDDDEKHCCCHKEDDDCDCDKHCDCHDDDDDDPIKTGF